MKMYEETINRKCSFVLSALPKGRIGHHSGSAPAHDSLPLPTHFSNLPGIEAEASSLPLNKMIMDGSSTKGRNITVFECFWPICFLFSNMLMHLAEVDHLFNLYHLYYIFGEFSSPACGWKKGIIYIYIYWYCIYIYPFTVASWIYVLGSWQ